MLQVQAVSKSFGGVQALDAVSFEVHQGEILALIGPNGAGKTTTFNMISGLARPDSGTVLFEGRRIEALSPHRRAALSIARTFQHVQLMPEASVLENVMVGAHLAGRSGLLGAIFRPPGQRREEAEAHARSLAALARCGLAGLEAKWAGDLAYGQQRRVELARALAMAPRLLLLDEPAAGLNDLETAELGALIRAIRNDGMTILLVEHAMGLVMSISDRVAVLDFGRKIAEGTPDKVRADPAVIEAYLGLAEDDA